MMRTERLIHLIGGGLMLLILIVTGICCATGSIERPPPLLATKPDWTEVHEQGRRAQRAGVPAEANPWNYGVQRRVWLDGWIAAKEETNRRE